MGDRSKIEWTDASWNPVRARNRVTGGVGHFCVHASEGCRNCYAERLQPRFMNPIRFAAQDRDKVEIFLDEKMLTQPLRWKRPRRIFVGSMTDLFADFVTDDMLDRIFAVMALCPQHTFQLLTKRPGRMRRYLTHDPKKAAAGGPDGRVARAGYEVATALGEDVNAPYWDVFWDWPLRNVWLGVSAEDQATADERIPLLLETPAAVRFVSYEPALGPIDFTAIAPSKRDSGLDFVTDALRGATTLWDAKRSGGWGGVAPAKLDLIIVGGESGPDARPMHPTWARTVRDQCAAAGVPFFFKQWGEHLPGTLDKHRDMIAWQDGRDEYYGEHQDIKYSESWLDNTKAGELILAYRIGRQRAGRLLDGREHNDLPQPETIRSQPAAG
jgi:protein gp37